ncbi:3-isopropylmalate dehydratase small subunit [Polynucleobacter sp. AP-Elch-400A-B2]|uniref:3-isopropylmalate dehydratase small subunit n=1 Tax=Polynucleobacter sp. AP-Elch-400A-B2 TaxID=2576930 RepID=UPI001BFE64E1|nr:3-isopropylmalate dehydratase small subunit [Polynucleobacter sp. AP-Elch-400A-B2]QWE24326.1 3-isopropylmalate dehydratase small subunit [Polynucleobacter sp. AP-Elch-400A-B2]
MHKLSKINGHAASLRIANFDTDQVMPKQFLRGIDKSGLAQGLFYDLRFDEHGEPKQNFFLNQPAYAKTDVLIAGSNYGCGSSREHAVWGMQQFGFKAVIASSFAEIFYSNAMGNGLLLVVLPEDQVQALMKEADDKGAPISLDIDIESLTVRTINHQFAFAMSARHRRMFLEGLDVIGLTLKYKAEIDAFAQEHWNKQAWVKDVARKTMDRLS